MMHKVKTAGAARIALTFTVLCFLPQLGSGTAHAVAADSPHFAFSKWATVDPASGWSFVSGQFDGSGGTDVVGYHPSNGTLWMGRNTGTSFTVQKRATVGHAAGLSCRSVLFEG